MSSPFPQPLRKGFSTGANAAAAITAAWRTLNGENISESIPLLFPDGETRTLPLAASEPGFSRIIKDGGDDPDCTHGAVMEARVRAAVPAFSAPSPTAGHQFPLSSRTLTPSCNRPSG